MPARALALFLLLPLCARGGSLSTDDIKAPASLALCDRLVEEHPGELLALFCYRGYSLRAPSERHRPQAQAHLRARLSRTPDDAGLAFLLGLLLTDENGGDPEAEGLFQGALERARREGRHELVVAAAQGLLLSELCPNGRFDKADAVLALAEAAARADGREDVLGAADYLAGECAFERSDYGRALLRFDAARRRLEHDPGWRGRWYKQSALEGQANALSETGRHREALELYLQDVALTAWSPYVQSGVRHFVAREAQALADEGQLPREEADALLERALEAELATGNQVWQRAGALNTRVLRAQRLGPTEAGIAELELALRGARQTRDPRLEARALRLLARFRALREPQAPGPALEAAESALRAARSEGSREGVARGLLTRAWIERRAGVPAWPATVLEALDELDRLRARQPDPTVRTRASAAWAWAYRLAAGWLLEGPAPDVARAFSVMERLRGRVLLDVVEAGHRTAGSATRERLLTSLSRVQGRLLAPALRGDERGALLAELSRLEAAEAALDDEEARAAGARPPGPPPSLAQVQAALGPGEALLAFSTAAPESGEEAPFPGASSWVLSVEPGAVRAFRIPDLPMLEAEVALFESLVEQRDGSERAGAARLYRELLDGPLRSLPSGTKRLLLLADGPLHRLPFAALRPSPDAPPVGAALSLSLAPSAGLWLRLRGEKAPPGRAALLAFADPQLPDGAAAGRDPGSSRGARGPLPSARREGSQAVLAAGPGSVLLQGPEASERLLKTSDLSRFGVVHFATHALLDEVAPERSAVLLASGDPGEDGLLQPREIVRLALGGKLVVLATCRSSAGPVLQGEGVMSLARAFLEAGSAAVLGSLWPLRDEESAELLGAFYGRLAKGEAVGDALAGAAAGLQASGAPTAAWAGLVVLGDGGRSLEAQPAPPRAVAGWLLPALAALLLAAGAWALARRAR